MIPWLDWQFYLVTAAAAWGLWIVLRQLLPSSNRATPACGTCASGAAACARPGTAGPAGSTLVVLEGRRPAGD